jgi:hypothetical protein
MNPLQSDLALGAKESLVAAQSDQPGGTGGR